METNKIHQQNVYKKQISLGWMVPVWIYSDNFMEKIA